MFESMSIHYSMHSLPFILAIMYIRYIHFKQIKSNKLNNESASHQQQPLISVVNPADVFLLFMLYPHSLFCSRNLTEKSLYLILSDKFQISKNRVAQVLFLVETLPV